MRPLIVAHRGASRREPPGNTVPAFRRARELGADWVELDARLTADGAVAVHHDAALPDGRDLRATRSDELPAHVPLLDAALAACEGMGVNVEIKNSPGDPDYDPDRSSAGDVVGRLTDLPRAGLLVTSFDMTTVDRVRALDGTIPTGVLVHEMPEPERLLEVVAVKGHGAVNPHDSLVDERFVWMAHEAGLRVNVWTVNEPARMRQLIELEVDAIITDVPDALRSIAVGR